MYLIKAFETLTIDLSYQIYGNKYKNEGVLATGSYAFVFKVRSLSDKDKT